MRNIDISYRYMTKSDIEIIKDIEVKANPFPWTIKNFTDCLRNNYYCLIQEVKNQFRFLKYGLGIILVIIGLKMAFEYILDYHINIYFSLSAIVVVITGSILLSSLLPEKNGSNPIKN